MALKSMMSFSSGELDPILHDRVTLEKFKKGLATARNVVIGKTGSVLTRFSRAHFVKSKNDNEAIRIHFDENFQNLTEWGPGYVRFYDKNGVFQTETTHPYLAADLPNIHFVPSSTITYLFVAGKAPIAFQGVSVITAAAQLFSLETGPVSTLTSSSTVGPPAGYPVQYFATAIKSGQETEGAIITGSFLKPDAPTHSNTLNIQMTGTGTPSGVVAPEEVRVYRRPDGGGAFGYLGSTTEISAGGIGFIASFTDVGSLADFTNGPPSLITKGGLYDEAIEDLNGKTGAIYQQRLLITTEDDEEAILASRPGYKNNFYRDFPYDADSALQFKSGTTGKAKVLRIIENDGLIVFTSVGVYVNVGTLSINNVAMEKKGDWVIDERLPPLAVPGGVFFVDKSTNSIKQLTFSQNNLTYQTVDHTIFSDHLFRRRTIKSWAFQSGVTPLIIVTFTDGTMATFTYNFEHQMRAWTRHDSVYPVEQVEGSGIADSTFFVTNKNGNRYIEVSLPRRVPADVFESNSEADKLALNSFMDAVKTKSNLLTLTGNDVFTVVPVTPGVWDGDLTLTCGTSGLFPTPGLGDVGTVLRFFDTTDRSIVDLEVKARANDNEVTVEPLSEFPEGQASGFRLYETFNVIDGLDHLEGESVSVFSDGYVLASPNNDHETYPTLTVTGGQITLPDNERGAIVVVGRPITADIKTLNISTVAQSPTLIESLVVDKVYLRIHESRGMYISNEFPEEKKGEVDGSTVKDMEDLHRNYVPDGFDITANRYNQPVSTRFEQILPGMWDSNGQMSIRQVDPLHFEILSIIPDVEVLNRSNR